MSTVQELLEAITKLLPVQAPLPSFIHNNILQPFENLPFDEGLKTAGSVYHSHLYMFENYYLNAIKNGRIQDKDIEHILSKEFDLSFLSDASPLPGLNRLQFYRQLLKEPPEFIPESNLKWRLGHDYLIDHTRTTSHLLPRISHLTDLALKDLSLEEKNDLWKLLHQTPSLDLGTKQYIEKFHDQHFFQEKIQKKLGSLSLKVLWAACVWCVDHHKLQLSSPVQRFPTLRYKRFFQTHFNDNLDDIIHPPLVKLISTYLDQGLAVWSNPAQGEGLWKHFEYYFFAHFKVLPSWGKHVKKWMKEYQEQGLSRKEIIALEMKKTELAPELQEEYVKELALDLRGWAGLINKMEKEPHLAPVQAPTCVLEDYIALRLMMERAVVISLKRKHAVAELPPHGNFKTSMMSKLEVAYTLFQVAFSQGYTCLDLYQMPAEKFYLLMNDLERFDKDYRKKLLHHAFEFNFYSDALDSIWAHSHGLKSPETKTRTQVLFCIDDREESLRRHVEAIDPKIETFGVVGFFGLDMYFKRALHPKKIPHCPFPVTPRKTVFEKPKANMLERFNRIKQNNDLLSNWSLNIYYGTRSLVRGFFFSIALGIFSPIYLFFRTFLPTPLDEMRRSIKKVLKADFATEFTLKADPTVQNVGYNLDEMTDLVLGILQSAGLTKNFSPLVVLMGHGSQSVNNPHLNAYGCGACGGRPGAPNARAFAVMANDPLVREKLVHDHHIHLSDKTFFIGAFHDTCDDHIDYFDLDLVPESHQRYVEIIKSTLNKATKVNAQERARRFKNAPQNMLPEEAHEHVHARSLDLSEPRPEYGHLKVAMCVVGRRKITRGLNLERRSFLVSYDPTIDADGSILRQVLLNSLPVCAGINLDYFFSFMDSEKFGCGSKLPLNITGLLGVITGSTGDVRIGLSRQAVDQHEPVRLLVIVEAYAEHLLKVIQDNPRVKNLVHHHWIQMCLMNPETREMMVFENGVLVPFTPESKHLRAFGFGSSVLNERAST
jgi:uncharacterized protein